MNETNNYVGESHGAKGRTLFGNASILARILVAGPLAVALVSCGARTGLRVPDFVERRPQPPPQCATQPATITITPTLTLDTTTAPLPPPGRRSIRFVDWTIRNTCSLDNPPNPPNSERIGRRLSLACNIVGGVSGLATTRRVTGDCAGDPNTGTPSTFQVDDRVPGQPGTSERQITAMVITGGNVCVSATVTYGDGTIDALPPAMWRVTTVNAPIMGFIIRGSTTTPLGTVSSPVGVVDAVGSCPFR
jgi:hypothetical protein